MTYLSALTRRLAGGLARETPGFRARHAAYLRGRQNPDGGFPGRAPGSDLYYTGFALRGLAALGELTPEIAARAAGFLRTRLRLGRETAIIDFVSLLYSAALVRDHGGPDVMTEMRPDWGRAVAEALEAFRSADGGYAKTPDNASGSTYHTFLVGLCLQLAGVGIPDPGRAVRFVLSRRRDDGGFVEVAPMKRGGTNPTAAAVGLLLLLNPGPDILPEDEGAAALGGVIDFLAGLQSDLEGGFAANTRVPVADLLSTFTAMLTLNDLDAADRIDREAAAVFLRTVEGPDGGFRGWIGDEAVDAEYTFYGLGTAALLRMIAG